LALVASFFFERDTTLLDWMKSAGGWDDFTQSKEWQKLRERFEEGDE